MEDLYDDNSKKLKVLWGLLSLLIVVALFFLSSSLLLTMLPTDADIIAAKRIAEYKDLKPSEYKCIDDGPAVCIYHRTKDQIEWLNSSPIPRFNEPEGSIGKQLNPRLRSIKPEYFVFWTIRGKVIESKCDDNGFCWYKSFFTPTSQRGWKEFYSAMVFFQNGENGIDISDGIYFSWDSGYYNLKPLIVYDLAGRLLMVDKKWLPDSDGIPEGLKIPPHYYDENDELIINRPLEESYTNRIKGFLINDE